MRSMEKDKVLKDLASLLDENRSTIIDKNRLDLAAAESLDATLYDRLKVDDSKVNTMIKSIADVIKIEDPIGEVLSYHDHPNGMKVTNKVVPFGKILIIYESRPDVTIEAAISAFKAGNKIFLKGGKEARHSNLYLIELWHEALVKNAFDKSYINYLDLSREDTQALISDIL